MPAKHDREETMSANEINPTKCLKHSETPTLNELAEELIQNVIYAFLLRLMRRDFLGLRRMREFHS